MTPRLPKCVLVVDDDAAIVAAISRLLTRAGYECFASSNLHDAVRQVGVHGHRLGLVITDLSLARESGMSLVHHLHRRRPSVPVVVLTAFGDWDLYAEALGEGVREFLCKPIQPEPMLAVVEKILGPSVGPKPTEVPGRKEGAV